MHLSGVQDASVHCIASLFHSLTPLFCTVFPDLCVSWLFLIERSMQLKYLLVVNMLHSLHQQSNDFYLNKYLMSTYYVPIMLSTENLREN